MPCNTSKKRIFRPVKQCCDNDVHDGEDGFSPYINDNGNWTERDPDSGDIIDTGVKAEGQKGESGENGITPHIGDNGDWFIGDEDTGTKAQGGQGDQGEQGPPGPELVANGFSLYSGSDSGGSPVTITLDNNNTNPAIYGFEPHTEESSAIKTRAIDATLYYLDASETLQLVDSEESGGDEDKQNVIVVNQSGRYHVSAQLNYQNIVGANVDIGGSEPPSLQLMRVDGSGDKEVLAQALFDAVYIDATDLVSQVLGDGLSDLLTTLGITELVDVSVTLLVGQGSVKIDTDLHLEADDNLQLVLNRGDTSDLEINIKLSDTNMATWSMRQLTQDPDTASS